MIFPDWSADLEILQPLCILYEKYKFFRLQHSISKNASALSLPLEDQEDLLIEKLKQGP